VWDGGQGGIRTHGTLSRTHAFQACALNHSATCPSKHLHFVKTANHWNGAIYTDEFAGINPNLTVFLFAHQFVVVSAIAMRVPQLYPEVDRRARVAPKRPKHCFPVAVSGEVS
jgi:hypothetical protein